LPSLLILPTFTNHSFQGYYCVLLASVVDADVYAFTSSESKIDARPAMSSSPRTPSTSLRLSLDIFISTRDVTADVPKDGYMSLFVINRRLVYVGLPEDRLPDFAPMVVLRYGGLFECSHIETKAYCFQTLNLMAKKSIKQCFGLLPMKDVLKAIEGVKANKLDYRYGMC
jgi:D-arabinose 1-dehydrogenase-like Zn-dependent alcohol dehydrogenase